MIPIDLEDLDWASADLKRALDALDQAAAEATAEDDPEERRKLIKLYRGKWVALRPFLAELSHNKCWYIECRNPGTDDDVDHFRPKLAVEEDPAHPGYYWLAFTLNNLRLSCHRANRPRTNPETGETGGKAGHFPLLDPSARAFGPGDNTDAEKPGLFDPTDPEDPRFISFRPNGEAFLTPKYQDSEEARRRFEYSRLYLHLNWPAFSDERHILYNTISRKVTRAQRAAPNPPDQSSGSQAFKDAILDLRRMMAPRSEYSAAATNYIQTFRGDYWWIDDIVLRSIP